MNHELICSWLEIAADQWPPNHYALLGLERGESNIERIEQRVHERFARLRNYQLNHPEQVSEAMNLLAQALLCLTEPGSKQAYDAALSAPPPIPQAPPAPVEPPATPPAEQPKLADWATSPPPQQQATATTPAPAEPEQPAAAAPAVDAAAAAEPVTQPTPPPPEPVDPVVAAAQMSAAARRGLGTQRSTYHRIARTRQLLWAWEQVGKYLSRPSRRLTKNVEAAELSHLLDTIRDSLDEFPTILGGVGQPGYFVVALARQEMVAPTFRTLLPDQRQRLADDWNSGRELLVAHRNFLRRELHALRRKGLGARLARALRTLVNEYPYHILLAVGLLALIAAVVLHLYARSANRGGAGGKVGGSVSIPSSAHGPENLGRFFSIDSSMSADL